MKENLELSLDFVLHDEGGFALRQDEPGGAVNKGISFLVFKEWRKRQGKPTPTIKDLRDLSDKEAKEIYTDLYANGIKFDDLPSGTDYVVLNSAVMQGIRGGLDLYEKSGHDPAMMLFLQAIMKLKAKSVGKFGNGWADRLVRVKDRYVSMK